MSFALKKQIKRELLASDWAGKVEEAAVAALATILEEQHGGQLDALQDILRGCTSELSAEGKITATSVHAAVANNGGAPTVELIEFVDAFSVPRMVFDPVQRKLHLDNRPRHIHASAEAKHQVYLQRLLMIQQRLQRNRMFQQSRLLLPNSNGGAFSVQLTDLQSLRGVFGVTRYVLGCISRAEDGRYVLEDVTGAVPLDLSAAETAAGFYTENCVVIAEGSLGHDGAFHVRALGLPPAEPRSALPLAAQRLNYWGGAGGGLGPDSEAGAMLALEEAQRGAADRVVVLADMWLDRPEVMDCLHTVLAGFSGVLTPPSVFVLTGNFHSRAGAGGGAGHGGRAGVTGDAMLSGSDVDYGTMRQLFGQLAAAIDQYPRLKAESRFVFLPGPDDPGPGAVLPQPPLSRSLTTELRRVLPGAIFASNPCRLRYATQHIVLFRHDLQRRLRRRTLLPLAGAADGTAPAPASQADPAGSASQSGPSPSALWGHLALTLLQQAHLAPLPLLAQPVYWQHDAALSLYPLPDAVILADATAAQEEFAHEGCRVINPGCFPAGFFAAYLPCVQQVEMSELPRPGQEVEEEAEEQQRGADGMEAVEVGDQPQGLQGEEVAASGRQALARAPLQQRQTAAQPPPPQQQQEQRQKAAAAAGGKLQKSRQPRAKGRQGEAGRGRQAQLQVEVRAAIASDVAAAAAAEGHEDGADAEDMEMREAGEEPRAGGNGGGAAAANVEGRSKGRGGRSEAAKGTARQGTLAQAWAKQPQPRRSTREVEVVELEDEDADAGVERGGDGADDRVDEDQDMEDGGAGAQDARRRQQARKRRAMVMEEEEGNGDGAAEVEAATWLDKEEEDWLEDE